MKEKLSIVVMIVLVSFTSLNIQAQSESFELGKQAFLEGRNNEALKNLQKAVLHEKFQMKGKNIPLAYAYMALIKNDYLELKLEEGTFLAIKNNPGLLKLAIADINSAIEFHDKGANGIVEKAKKKLVKNATKIGQEVIDSLMQLDFENHTPEVLELAAVLNYELKDLSSIDGDNWQLHDILGFTHYMLDEMELAMLEFKRGRDIYNDQNIQDTYDLHLYNCLFSAKYQYKVTKNYIEANNAAKDGKEFVNRMMENSESDDIKDIRRLSSLENTFASIQSRVENMDSISSNKE